ncbi:hypothetical protein [Arthrobacter sp. SLBN-53]|uniref:hypothetical protein n=1 Tax=Arthrobacter sp. SLBN-53 TaxID=2768412 RepID=UPI00256FC1C4|nr:hypothetical protein [Arthrobacter sp. SLBN-53]
MAADLDEDRLRVHTDDLDVTVRLGGAARFDGLLRLVPAPLARAPWVSGTFGGVALGGPADLHPPVRFGFSSAPTDPQLVTVTTTIDLP